MCGLLLSGPTARPGGHLRTVTDDTRHRRWEAVPQTPMQATPASTLARRPVTVTGSFDNPSRWLWLVKWLLVVPHLVLLALLWVAFAVSSVAAFVAILITGSYPRSLFDFNLGVLRWTWRVTFYAYGVNGTDRYPPFTLGPAPDYPATLDVAYPQHQRRGLALIGWWLAGIPQYVIVAVLAGGGWGFRFGVMEVLVLTASIVLLFRGRYPESIYDLVLGLNRWTLRVVAYSAFMVVEYPPFRIDPGEFEPGEPAAAAAAPDLL